MSKAVTLVKATKVKKSAIAARRRIFAQRAAVWVEGGSMVGF
jgi:hypothetical protein